MPHLQQTGHGQHGQLWPGNQQKGQYGWNIGTLSSCTMTDLCQVSPEKPFYQPINHKEAKQQQTTPSAGTYEVCKITQPKMVTPVLDFSKCNKKTHVFLALLFYGLFFKISKSSWTYWWTSGYSSNLSSLIGMPLFQPTTDTTAQQTFWLKDQTQRKACKAHVVSFSPPPKFY